MNKPITPCYLIISFREGSSLSDGFPAQVLGYDPWNDTYNDLTEPFTRVYRAMADYNQTTVPCKDGFYYRPNVFTVQKDMEASR